MASNQAGDPPAVELRKVSKHFAGGVKAVDNLSLQISAGRVVALLGPSGCGKTTTLRLINRLEEPTEGQIFVRGQDVHLQRPEVLRRSIGYVIQEGGLFPHRDVSTNVATVPRLLGWQRDRIQARVAEVLALVGLPEIKFGGRLPAELSGGQRHRVGFARALAADPDLLLMDEPFGALDPGTREAIQDEFLRLNERLKKTVVLVTHDVAEAGKMAEDIVLLDQGRLVQRGSLRELLNRPAGEAVRNFFGSRRVALTLEAVHLKHLLPEIPAAKHDNASIRLAADLPLGQVLAALADAQVTDTVSVNGDAKQAWSARDIRTRILADLKDAAARGAPLQGASLQGATSLGANS